MLSRREFLHNSTMAFASLHVAGTTASSTDLMVSTPAGRIRGVAANNAALFRGVPFAQPPVGQLRFRPPVPAKPWPGVRNATEFAPAAIQLAETSFAQSEDCLYLNTGGRTGAVEWDYGPLRLAPELAVFTDPLIAPLCRMQ
jgi:para-nitrobenzyl esterase